MTAAKIKEVRGRRVWDSRGRPTVEVDVLLENGALGRAIAPAGASRGTREAVDLRDGGDFLGGMGVNRAVANVDTLIGPALAGSDIFDQEDIDKMLIELDGTALKTKIGGNAMVATSLAVLHAAAASQRRPLWAHIAAYYGTTPTIPLPEIQIFGGGAHAGRRVDIQDFMIMVPGADSFDEVMEVTASVYRAAGEIMAEKSGTLGVADEGGWWPVFGSNEEALDCLVKAIERAGEQPGERVVISLDIAASEFSDGNLYRLALEERNLSSSEMIDLLEGWIRKYPIVSIEDPLAEDDTDGMRTFAQKQGSKVQIVGDDYLVTNARLVKAAAEEGTCNTVLIKVNQAGTVSEAVDAFKAANAAGFSSIVSARSGETEDVSISHLAAGLNTGQLKVGSFTRSERMAKWNECLRMQHSPGMGEFAGARSLKNTWWAKGTR